MYEALSFLVAALTSLILMPWVLRLCQKKSLYDIPDARKVHKQGIPRLGGMLFVPAAVIGFVIGLVCTPMLLENQGAVEYKALLAGVGLLLIYLMGVLDDLLGLSANVKLLVQTIAACTIPLSDIRMENLYGILGVGEMNSWFACVLTIFGAVFVMNAVNMIDGIDGLCAGLSLIALGVFGYCFHAVGSTVICILIAAIVGALVVFVPYNLFGDTRHGRKIFMGDSGSLSLGFILYCLGVSLSQSDVIPPSGVGNMMALSLLMIPCLDLVRVAIGRVLHGQHPFHPDKTHIHHLLLAAGLGQRQALLVLLTADILLVAANIFAYTQGVNINVVMLADIVIYGAGFWGVMRQAK